MVFRENIGDFTDMHNGKNSIWKFRVNRIVSVKVAALAECQRRCNLDLISSIIVSGVYLMYYLREESQIWCKDASVDADMLRSILGSL